MKLLKYVVSLALVMTLAACGGGGGNPGTSSGALPPVGEPAAVSTLSVGLSGGGNSITASGSTVAQATVKDASGAPVNGKLVTFSGDPSLIKFSPVSGQVLTVDGVASIQVSPTSLTSAGAGTLIAQTTFGTTALSSSFDFQLSAANLGLQNLNLGAGSLSAFGNRPISVMAIINGVAATNTPVQVTFTASCGTVAPSIATTDAAGVASATYTASLPTCAGTNVSISAAAVGATSVTGTVAVGASIATNVQFISTTPQLIYLKDSVGSTQAQVVFKVVDSSGNPLQNKKLRLTLSNTATGVSLDTMGNTAPVDMTTDSAGLVSAAVFSGTVPTSLIVKATLLDSNNVATTVFSDSNLLTVASGRPTQRSLSISLSKQSLQGRSVDGDTSEVTLSMADRQGNPVPPGTQVNFVSEAGVFLPAVCFVPPVIPATAESPAIPVSYCRATFRTQGTTPAVGRVSIMAYVAGEEDFVDKNGNNFFDSGDTFTDLGRAFRDDNALSNTGLNGVFDSGEFQVPRVGAGACIAGAVECVGDGVWGAADVRRHATIVFASDTANISAIELNSGGIVVDVKDQRDDSIVNSVPTGSTIVATTSDRTENDSACVISGTSSVKVANKIGKTTASFGLAKCASGDVIIITVTTPPPTGFVSGTATERAFVIP